MPMPIPQQKKFEPNKLNEFIFDRATIVAAVVTQNVCVYACPCVRLLVLSINIYQ